jgi:hypothetical protein
MMQVLVVLPAGSDDISGLSVVDVMEVEAVRLPTSHHIAHERHTQLAAAERTSRLFLGGHDLGVSVSVASDGSAIVLATAIRLGALTTSRALLVDVRPVACSALSASALEVAAALLSSLRSRLLGVSPVGFALALCVLGAARSITLRLRIARAGLLRHLDVPIKKGRRRFRPAASSGGRQG